MKTNKTKKRKSGFTLVELIVVIAILAILAGIAIPVYSGYIKKANEAADLSQLDSIKTAAVFAAVENRPEDEVTAIAVTVENKKPSAVTVTYKSTTTTGEGEEATTTSNTFTATTKVLEYVGGTWPEFKSDTYGSGGTINWTAATQKWAPAE